MTIYELSNDCLDPIPRSDFASSGVRERTDLQRLLKEKIEIISPETLVIAEEFSRWEDSRRRIDLLGLDRNANLVVIELKRTEDGGYMDLQAIRYAAMVSTMTFESAVDVYREYLESQGLDDMDPEQEILAFLEWDEPNEEAFARDVRIVLASAEFSKELTTTILWLNERQLDIRCVRLRPYSYNDKILVDVTQLIPLPEAEEYQVRLREKVSEMRQSKGQWNKSSFFSQMKSLCSPDCVTKAERLLDWASENAGNIEWGHGANRGNFKPRVSYGGDSASKYNLFVVWADGKVAIKSDELCKKKALATGSPLTEYLQALDNIDGIDAKFEPRKRTRFDLHHIAESSLGEFIKATEALVLDIAAWHNKHDAG